MTKPIADRPSQLDADHQQDHELTERSLHRNVAETVYHGFFGINLDPSPTLRKFRCELQDYSDSAVTSAWSNTARAIAAATDAELHLHGADRFHSEPLDTAPRIMSILKRAYLWDVHPDRTTTKEPEALQKERPTVPTKVTVEMEGPEGTLEASVPSTTATRARLLRILKTMATEPHEK